ncbi:MAG: hypothetical protein ACI9K2_006422 [Myxococcota bacterium]|jgi:uncharacterized protein YlxP (DUF503 family)
MHAPVFIGVLRLQIVIRGARSKKDLRRPTVSLRDRLSSRFGLAVHQVSAAERPARSVLVGVTVGNDARELRSALDKAARYCVDDPVVPVGEVVVDVFRWDYEGMMTPGWRPDVHWSDDE